MSSDKETSMIELLNRIDKLKAELDGFRPFEGNLLKQIRDYYKIGLTYTSNALEGNSLTESETKVLLEDGLTVGGKPIRDYYEATGHAEAYEHVFALAKNKLVTQQDIQQIHHLFYRQIDRTNAGMYRRESIVISGSHYPTPPPESVPSLMQDFEIWLAAKQDILHPVEYAALAHKEFVFIHPFIDGNGRVARLLMNLCLLRKGFTVAIIPPVLRAEYITLLEKAHTNDKPFIRFIAESVMESQKELLHLISPDIKGSI
jgi:Fic family protein